MEKQDSIKEINENGYTVENLVAAHKHSANHKAKLEQDDVCGCFHCCKVFSPKEIIDWYDDEGTAVCPYCYIDSVIGKSSGYEITEEFLIAMEDYFFGLRRRRFRYEDDK